jgi:hypothetical protein
VADLNNNPDQFRSHDRKGTSPESIQGTYRMPPFPSGELPSPDEWQDVVDWLLEKGLIDQPIAYESTVSADLAKK